jgi:hypothetical protein
MQPLQQQMCSAVAALQCGLAGHDSFLQAFLAEPQKQQQLCNCQGSLEHLEKHACSKFLICD